jgi:hypothetical protein
MRSNTSWAYGYTICRPAILFSVVTAVVSICFGVILSRGITTVWWRTALYGTTLEKLHHIWSSGDSVFFAAFSGQNFTVVSLAKIMVLISTASIGPLLQKSSHVETLAVNTEDMNLNIATDFYHIDLGTIHSVAGTFIIEKSPGLRAAVQDFFNGTAMNTKYPCRNKICQGTAPAPILERYVGSWDTSLTTLDLTTDGVHNLFELSFDRNVYGTHPGLYVRAKYAESIDENCVATMRTQILEYVAARGTQGVLIQNDTVVIFEEFQKELVSEELKKGAQEGFTAYTNHPGDFPNATDGTHIGPLTALWWVGDTFLSGRYTFNRNDGMYTWDLGTAGLQYINADGYARCNGIDGTVPTFKSPFQDVDRELNSLIFRIAKHLAAPTDVQNFTVLVTEPLFVSNYPYLWAALGVYGAVLIATLVPLWAWWELGRTASMSPIETAHAFDAPIFRKERTNLTAEQLVATVGKRRVQYGVVENRDETDSLIGSKDENCGRLVLADTDKHVVEKPNKGQAL